jgi:protein-tyrosine phosphatase
MVKVLFVCMGNICRSPTAEGVFRHLVKQASAEQLIHIDSAGTHAYHIGEQPDRRSQATALTRNIDMSSQRARKVCANDFEEFDYILAMDKDNLQGLLELCPPHLQDKVALFMTYGESFNEDEVPDPYYGGADGFEHVFDLVEDASRGLLKKIRG